MENTIQKKLESVAISFTKFKDQYSACKYLYFPDTKEETWFLEKSQYFKMVKIALFRNSIIELCKIIKGSKNNYFNLYALFKAIKRSDEFDTNQLDKIRDLETKLKEISPTTDRILTLRNDFVAHTKLERIDPNIEFVELDRYVLQIEELIRQLYRIFDSHIEFSPILFDKERFNIISILAREKEQRSNSLRANLL